MLVITIKREIEREKKKQERREKSSHRMRSIIITWQTKIGSFMQFVVLCESVELHICANSLLAKQKEAMKVESCLFFLRTKFSKNSRGNCV